MGVAGIRRSGHHNADILCVDRRIVQSQRGCSTLRLRDRAVRESFPRALVLIVHGIAVAGPVLHFEILRVRISPLDADCVDVFFLVERDDDPLRVKRVVFSGELLRQIRIALPVRLRISVIEAGKSIELGPAVAGEAAMTKRVAIGMLDHFGGGSGIAGEVSLASGIAPLAFRIPVPRLHKQVGVLAITDYAPSG